MDYRDDRDALRARVENLESDLSAARAEVEQLRGVEAVLAATERENRKLREELEGHRRRSQGRGGAVMIALVAGAGLLITFGGAAFFLVSRPAPPEPPPDPPQWTTQQGPNAVEGPAPAATEAPSKSPRASTVEWPARVTRATGLPFERGAACAVRATVRSDGSALVAPDVQIVCPGKVLYRSTDALEGASTYSYGVDEAPGLEEGSYRVALLYQDQGTRTGERTQASVSTSDRVAVAWKDTAPAFRVELELDELSSSWKGPALFVRDETQRPAFRESVTRTGHADQVQGNGLVTQGAACTVRVRPSFGAGGNCRVAVQCGATTLYGSEGGGYAECVAEGGRVFSAKDGRPSSDDRDPALEASLPRGEVEVRDTTPNAWSVKVKLDP